MVKREDYLRIMARDFFRLLLVGVPDRVAPTFLFAQSDFCEKCAKNSSVSVTFIGVIFLDCVVW
jgi:hypothetical protein